MKCTVILFKFIVSTYFLDKQDNVQNDNTYLNFIRQIERSRERQNIEEGERVTVKEKVT